MCCPHMPQSALCMALYIGVCNAGDAANGGVLEGLVGMYGALLAGITGLQWRLICTQHS